MRIPAVKLIDLLAPDRVYALRSANYTGMDEALPYTHAIAMAVRGEVEGIATASQRIKFLRVLPESERPASTVAQEIDKSRSTAFARTNLGVFRQPVREVVCASHHGASLDMCIRALLAATGLTWPSRIEQLIVSDAQIAISHFASAMRRARSKFTRVLDDAARAIAQTRSPRMSGGKFIASQRGAFETEQNPLAPATISSPVRGRSAQLAGRTSRPKAQSAR
jgi:hypothetical protein